MDKKENIEEVKISDSETVSEKPTKPSETEILTAQITELNDKYLRAVAELENTRRRSLLDIESAARSRAMSVAKNFLPVMDAIDAALSHSPNDEGIQSMSKAMESAFTKIGITRIESLGHQMNPLFHNAVQVSDSVQVCSPCSTKPAPNTIVGELQAGYMFGDTVLRPAMVVVSK